MGAAGSACQEAAGPASSPDFVARPMKTPATAAGQGDHNDHGNDDRPGTPTPACPVGHGRRGIR